MAVLLGIGTAWAGAAAPPTAASAGQEPDARPAVGAAEKSAPVTARPASTPEPIDYRSVDALLQREEYQYRSGGRDPFAPLVTTNEEGEGEQAEITDPGVADLIMVGRAWGGGRVFALAETPQGRGLLLRVGDRVRDGCVLAISPEGVTFSQATYGLVRQVTLPFSSVEEGRDER